MMRFTSGLQSFSSAGGFTICRTPDMISVPISRPLVYKKVYKKPAAEGLQKGGVARQEPVRV